MNFAKILKDAQKKAGFDEQFSLALKIAEPKFGDWQLNGALAYAKKAGMNPREVAQKFVEALEVDTKLVQVNVSGPGFINFTFTPQALVAQLADLSDAQKLSPMTRAGQKVLMEYGSPNVGKQMHIGNFRSYNIGEAISRIVEFCGAKVHRDNHLGDWGTQFGYLIWAIKNDPKALAEDDPNPLKTIDRLYKEANAKAKEDPHVLDAVRAELAKLQAGDAENMALWKKLLGITLNALEKFHTSFGTRYDTIYGESHYNDRFERVYAELQETGLAKMDDGALVVFHPEHPRFKEQPFIVKKSDGAGNYATSDLATMLLRSEMKVDFIYIVVDFRQSDHFDQLWLTTQKWFKAKGYHLPAFEHVAFGMILGEDGKPIKTRSGESVKLMEVLDEAVERARKVVDEKNPELPEAERAKIAEVVGIDAVRYADLAQNRTSDYQFSWDKLLSFEGNTAPYMLYAVARLNSLFEKLNRSPQETFADVTTLETPGEIALARKLIQAPYAISLAAADLRPHFLATYLYELTGAFGGFYNSERLQGEPTDVQNRRLMLCAKTLLVLETGLHLLGLKTVKRM